ncbi:MAG: hypothetical protein ABH951_01025 [Patescibacteria group bacterium]
MEKKIIRNIEFHFDSSTDDARRWLEYGLTSEGFEKLFSNVKKGQKNLFTDGYFKKYDLESDSEDESKKTYSVKRHY